MRAELKKKVDQAIRLLRLIPTDKTIEVSYSGGKDSDVILELAKMAGIPFEAIYKNTTIDPPGTIAHCKAKGVKIVKPKNTFFQIIEKHGFPTRRARFCCSELKEYKIHDYAIQGIRRSESRARSERYHEPQICRFYGSKKNHVSVFLPILEWTDEDVAEFIEERGIKCHPLYYDKDGNFDVKKRLGCMGCPLQSAKKRREEFLKHPKWLKAWINAGVRYWESHPNIRGRRKFNDPYELLYQELFCNSYEDFHKKLREELLFPEARKTAKQLLEEYFGIEL